jgi:hypothetical protein
MSDELVYSCSVETILPLGASTPKWPSKEIAYAFLHFLPESLVSIADQKAITRDNWQSVSAVCGLRAVLTDDVRDAHVVYAVGKGRRAGLDGTGGTLALAYLPVGVSASYRNGGQVGAGLVLFDVDESWTSQKPYGRRIGYQPVNWHEGCGHATGLSHNPSGGTIMAAMYNPNTSGPAPWEVSQLVDRYGKATGTVDPPPPKPVSAQPSKIQVLMSDNTVWQFDSPTKLR